MKKDRTEIPLCGSAIESVSCNEPILDALLHDLLMNYFAPVIDEVATKQGKRSSARREQLEALANWAADSVADEARYFFLNIYLPSFMVAAADAALHAAGRRAVENLSRLQPSGEFGLRDAAER